MTGWASGSATAITPTGIRGKSTGIPDADKMVKLVKDINGSRFNQQTRVGIA
jgi:hypothetical protein